MAVNVAGLVVVIVLYILIILVGFLASRMVRVTSAGESSTELSMVAGRNLGLFVGIFTMTATSVGGGYLSGTTEAAATLGLAWTVFPFTIILAFMLGSLIFAKPMREKKYVTLLDPLQERFGDVMTGLLLLGALFAELLWGATILIALGTSLSVIIDLDVDVSICISALVAMVYTMFGQMVSVAYTDILQLTLVFIGMVLCVPFAMTNPAVGDLSATRDIWLGSIPRDRAASWADYFISQVLGGIPWNTYMMRILSAKSVRHAQVISTVGGLFGWAMAIPPFLLGVVGISADWNNTVHGVNPVDEGDAASLMPLVIQNFTPQAVSIIALSAIVAAVMSSMDSIVLSSSSMFTHNIYRMAFRPKAREKEIHTVQVLAMFLVTLTSTLLALFSDTIVGLFVLTADVVYVILFPQLTCAVFIPHSNTYGSFCGFIIGLILRFGGGEPSLNLQAFIKYPNYISETNEQLFPFKTLAMCCSLVTIIAISYLTRYLFMKDILPTKWDITERVAPSTDVLDEDYSSTTILQKNDSHTYHPELNLNHRGKSGAYDLCTL